MSLFQSATDKYLANLDEEALYEMAGAEIASGQVIKGLYAKSVSISDADDKKVIATYLKLRVESLKAERAAVLEAEEQRQQFAKLEQERIELESNFSQPCPPQPKQKPFLTELFGQDPIKPTHAQGVANTKALGVILGGLIGMFIALELPPPWGVQGQKDLVHFVFLIVLIAIGAAIGAKFFVWFFRKKK